MEKEVKDFFECIAQNSRSRYETFDEGHGRIERRIYTPDTNIGRFTGKKERKNLAASGMCESITKRKDKKVSEKRYFITGVKDAEQFAKAVRNHRAIENNLYRCRDIIFHEEHCYRAEPGGKPRDNTKNRVQRNQQPLRRAYDAERSRKTAGIKPSARIKCCMTDTLSTVKRAFIYDDSFRAEILFSLPEALTYCAYLLYFFLQKYILKQYE